MPSSLPQKMNSIVKSGLVPVPVDKDKYGLLFKLNPKQLRFFLQYVKSGGKIGESYAKVYRIKDKNKAQLQGSQLYRRYPQIKRVLYEAMGLGDGILAKTMAEALSAEKQTIYKNKVYEFPDHYARLKAVEMANKLAGGEEVAIKPGHQTNVLIVNDKEKGVFRVEEENS